MSRLSMGKWDKTSHLFSKNKRDSLAQKFWDTCTSAVWGPRKAAFLWPPLRKVRRGPTGRAETIKERALPVPARCCAAPLFWS